MAVGETFVPAVVPRSQPRSWPQQTALRTGISLTGLAALPAETTWLYRIAAVDARGRIAAQSVVTALGWRPGERLRVEVISPLAIAVQPDPAGTVTLARREHIPLPVTARRWCHLHAADRVLLAATPAQGMLVPYTMSALEAMVTAVQAATTGGDRA